MKLTTLDRVLLAIALVIVWFFLVAVGAKANGIHAGTARAGAGHFGHGVIIIHQAPQPVRPIIIQAPPRRFTKAEAEASVGVYRGTGNAAATYGGGPLMIYNPFVQQKR